MNLLRTAGSLVRATDQDRLARALAAAGVTTAPAGGGALLAHADTEPVGTIAFAAGIPLVELRPADGAGLEEMFLHLTSDTQRDTVLDSNTTVPEGAAA